MIVLDTNVVWALMRPRRHAEVVAWIDQVAPESVWMTSITVLEIRFGIALVDDADRRRSLDRVFAAVLRKGIEDRVLDFDRHAAESGAAIMAAGRRSGRSIESRDLLIASVVMARKGTLATRNTRHFRHIGIPIINPWSPGAN